MRTLAGIASLLTLSVMTNGARADEPTPERKNALSYEPLAIPSRAFLLQYERLVASRVSGVLGAGVRFAAREDFSSETLVGHLEARYWVARRELITRRRGMVGPFSAVSVDVARTALANRSSGRSLGAIWTVKESLRFGYRFVIFGFQEIAPSFGVGLSHDFDERGRLASDTGLVLGASATVGWLF